MMRWAQGDSLAETDPRAPSDSPGRWGTTALLLLVLIPTVFNAIALFPELYLPIPSLNDDAVHYLLVQRASEALAGGENLFDHWVLFQHRRPPVDGLNYQAQAGVLEWVW